MSSRGPEKPDGEATRPRKRQRKGSGLGPTIGGILVGFDHEILRTTPPPHELVKRGAPVRRVAGQDGSDLLIGLPEDLAVDEVERGPHGDRP